MSIATLYRHFPDRRSLVTAVAADVMARTRAEARAALAEETDAFVALRRYMHRTLDVGAPALMPLLDEEVRSFPEVKTLLNSTAAAQRRLLRAAEQQGSLRAGVEFADVGLVLARFSRPIGGGFDPALEQGVAHRHLEIFIDGLREHGQPPLEGQAPTLRELPRYAPQESCRSREALNRGARSTRGNVGVPYVSRRAPSGDPTGVVLTFR